MKKFPTAFTILFVLIVVVAALTWIIPAGQYERAMNATLGREAPVPGTYAQVEPSVPMPQPSRMTATPVSAS